MKIKLGGGLVALIDDADRELAVRHRWRAHIANGKTYAATRWYEHGRHRRVTLHHCVLNGATGHVEFRNGNTLDCRRGNLRVKVTAPNQSPPWSQVAAQISEAQAHGTMTASEFRAWCERLRLWQKDAATAIGCRRQRIAQWERGQAAVPPYIARLCWYFERAVGAVPNDGA